MSRELVGLIVGTIAVAGLWYWTSRRRRHISEWVYATSLIVCVVCTSLLVVVAMSLPNDLFRSAASVLSEVFP